MKKGIYIASKIHHAAKWRDFRAAGYPIISTWINYEEAVTDYKALWDDCINECMNCNILIVYREPGDNLQGSLVEVGVALGNNAPVIAVGEFERDWHHYREVIHIKDIKKAMEFAQQYIKDLR